MVDETTPGDELPAKQPKYDQEFFLSLAAKGKDAWNAWRRDPANKDVRVTFEGVDFSEAPIDQIDFSGFEFGHHANFSKCKWRGGEWEEPGAFVQGRACFAGAAFGHEARFRGANFGNQANFTRATFRHGANFDGAAFAVFGDRASFAGAASGNDASFDNAYFEGRVEFTGMSEEQWARDVTSALAWNEKDREALEKRHKDSRETTGSRHRFLTISFSRARFDGVAVFSGRSFEKIANFTNARFCYPPNFDGVTNASRIDFTGAHIRFVPPGKLAKDSKFRFACAPFEKSRKKQKTTISNAISISRNERPSAASIGVNCRMS